MACLIRPVVRFGVIGALGLGASYLIAESVAPGSARAVAGQAKTVIVGFIADNVDDPVALRAQLRELESQYPDRIAQVRSDLTELQTQRRAFDRELAVAQRVISLAEQDLSQMTRLLSRAEEAQREASFGVVRVRYENESLDLDSAYAKASRIRELRDGYTARADEITRDLGYLSEQETQLADLLSQLETEHERFRQQLWQLDQQVDAIARNERMIDLMEKRQATIDRISPYSADSLDQVEQRLAQVRSEQEQRMASLSRSQKDLSYVERAKSQIEAESDAGLATGGLIEVTPPEIEIGEKDVTGGDEGPVAIGTN